MERAKTLVWPRRRVASRLKISQQILDAVAVSCAFPAQHVEQHDPGRVNACRAPFVRHIKWEGGYRKSLLEQLRSVDLPLLPLPIQAIDLSFREPSIPAGTAAVEAKISTDRDLVRRARRRLRNDQDKHAMR